MQLREERLLKLQGLSASLRDQSDAELSAAPAHVQNVLRSAGPFGAHPALLRSLLQEIGYSDVAVVDDLLRGFPLIGDIPIDPSAPARKVRTASHTEASLRAIGLAQVSAMASKQLHNKINSADFVKEAQEVFDTTVADSLLGRMSAPRRFRPGYLKFVTRRFAVYQRNARGSLKLRCIDDFHESFVNDACTVRRGIRMGRHSDLLWMLRELSSKLRLPLRLLKSDFKAAYRGCPIRSDHLDFANILLLHPSGDLFFSQQFAMPFGAVGAVYAWDRVGAAISAILRDYFLVPVVRYVDDLFWAETEMSADSCRTLVLEVVSLLGFTLEPSKTPLASESLDILGVTVSLSFDENGVVVSSVPDAAKVSFWLSDIHDCLRSGTLLLALASQLLGRLSFAAWAVWGQVARARLRPLYSFLLAGAGRLPANVRESFEWWERRLTTSFPRTSKIRSLASPIFLVYTDAEGSGGLGAVLSGDGTSEWCMGTADSRFLEVLSPRKTQIFALETVMVLLATVLWQKKLSGCRVLFFIDNTSTLGCLRKGSSKKVDVHAMVTFFWDFAALHHIEVHFRWVPSKLNLSDRPSRGKAPIVGSMVPFRCRWNTIILAIEFALKQASACRSLRG